MSERGILTVKVIFLAVLVIGAVAMIDLTAHNAAAQLGLVRQVGVAGPATAREPVAAQVPLAVAGGEDARWTP